MKKTKQKPTKRHILLGALLAVAAASIIFLALGGVNEIKKIYYHNKATSALSTENRKLGEPLKTLGFTDIEQPAPVCQYMKKYGYEGNPLDCTAGLKSYKVFSDDASKSQAINAAQKLSGLLQQNGWHQGDDEDEVGKWFQDVLNGVDYRADAYHYKYFGNTFCILDFFVAYSNPNPPAVNTELRCTVPETHPPIY